MSGFRWYVHGKHPNFADYFTIGGSTQFTTAYSRWMSLGYRQYMNNSGTSGQICSYRFWSQGDSDETFAVGLIQSSNDSLKRPFPLLFIGIALLPGWQKQWHDLDKQLDRVWAEVEKIARNDHESLQDFSADLEKISSPVLSQGLGPQHAPPEAAPNAVFLGGCGGKITRIRFTGPLTKQDFVHLWSHKNSPIL